MGKLRAIAKGVRRPKSRLGGNMELFTHVNVLVAQGRNLDIVTQAEAKRPFRHIRDDLWKASYASYAAELVDRFTEERMESRPIFDLLLEMLTFLDGLPERAQPGEVRERPGDSVTAARVEMAARNFELKLLGYLGYAPELGHCTECRTKLSPAENRFSAAAGGVLCDGCGALQPSARPISVNAIKALRLFTQEPFGVFERLRLPVDVALEVHGVLRSHVNYFLEKQLRTSEFLDRLKADHSREVRLAMAGSARSA